jgi:hypothetical protein
MKKVMVYPNPINKKSIKTHANVCGYFLAKYLSKFYDIISSDELRWESDSGKTGPGSKKSSLITESIKAVGAGADIIISTQQRGFTKAGGAKVAALKAKNRKIKLCSIHDHYGAMNYSEDALFLAIGPSESDVKKMKISSKNKNLQVIHSGWCADHELFSPKQNINEFNIVLDHAALQDFRLDVTNVYLSAIKKLRKKYKLHNKKINLCRIRKGFEFYDFDKNQWTHDTKLMWWTPSVGEDSQIENGNGATIFQIAECLSHSHIFCVTHVESCGLTGAEALMAGCKLYIPKGTDRFIIWGQKGTESIGAYENRAVGTYTGPFLKSRLLKKYMDYVIFDINESKILKLFENDFINFKLKTNRQKLIENNSWLSAAKKIYEGLK